MEERVFTCDWVGCNFKSNREMQALHVGCIVTESARHMYNQGLLNSPPRHAKVHLCPGHVSELRGLLPVTAIYEAIKSG